MTISLKTCVDPKTHKHEVVGASCLVHQGVNIDGATPPARGQLSHFSVFRAPGRGVNMPLAVHQTLKRQKLKSVLYVRGRCVCACVCVCVCDEALRAALGRPPHVCVWLELAAL